VWDGGHTVPRGIVIGSFNYPEKIDLFKMLIWGKTKYEEEFDNILSF